MLVGAVQTMANWWADNREVPREQLVESAMDFAWLGLDRLSRGERWTAGVNFARDVVDAADPARPALRGAGARRRARARSPSARWPTARRGWPARSPRAAWAAATW